MLNSFYFIYLYIANYWTRVDDLLILLDRLFIMKSEDVLNYVNFLNAYSGKPNDFILCIIPVYCDIIHVFI